MKTQESIEKRLKVEKKMRKTIEKRFDEYDNTDDMNLLVEIDNTIAVLEWVLQDA